MKPRKAANQAESQPCEDGGGLRHLEINARDGAVAAYHVEKQYLYAQATAPAATTLAIKPEIIGVARQFTHGAELMEAWAGFNDKRELDHERAARSRAAEEESSRQAAAAASKVGRLPQHDRLAVPAIMNQIIQQYSNPLGRQQTPPEQPKPRSDDEVRAAMQRYRDELHSRWDDCLDYLASVAWPALHFRITNEAPPTLKGVELIFTFHGAAGLEYIALSDVEWQKLTDPSWEPPAVGPFGAVSVPPIKVDQLPGYPVKWCNKGDDLVVTIRLSELRAHPPKELDGDDVVLIVRDGASRTVSVTWTATADGYDGYLEGEPFEVTIEEVDARESTQAAFDAAAAT